MSLMDDNALIVWKLLRAAGMSEVGAAAMLGNMQAESALRPNNAQDGMTQLSDEQYTCFVDLGTYANFDGDGVGYGFCQWTFPSRKNALLAYAKEQGASIGDAVMQVHFCIKEMRETAAALWAYLSGAPELYTAVSRICREYERPAVNNIDERHNYAVKWLDKFTGVAADAEPAAEETFPSFSPQPIRLLRLGLNGGDVRRWQQLLKAAGFDVGRYGTDGDFGRDTQTATMAFQRSVRISPDGVVGAETFGAMWRR